MVNNLFGSYFNMLQNKIKVLFKRRRNNKSRYSANKIYVSRAEAKHTNTKLVIILFIYNKQKSYIERYVRKHINLKIIKKYIVKDKIIDKVTHTNRITHILKTQFFIFSKFTIAFFKKSYNFFKYFVPNMKGRGQFKLHKIPVYYIILLKKLFRLQLLFFNAASLINFNLSKYNTLVLN